MSRLTLLHRDLSRRIASLKQIVESSNGAANHRVPSHVSASTASSSGPAKPPPSNTNTNIHQHRGNVGDMHSIDLNPNTNQLIIRCTRRKPPPASPQNNSSTANKSIPPAQRGESLDEGFESDVDTISLVSTESTISLLNLTRTLTRETDSANGSASSDSDDSDGNKQYSSLETTASNSHGTDQSGATNLGDEKLFTALQPSEDTETITEYFNLVNCVCYTDSTHPEILILVVSTPDKEEETLIFKFENSKELETFHENFSTVKAVAAQKTSPFSPKPFNLLQRTDSNGMTHIRISRPEDDPSGRSEEEFTSLLSLPSFPTEKEPVHKYEKFATMGKPRKRILKKSKSIEDLLDLDSDHRHNNSLKKIWSAENLLQIAPESPEKPKVPPRKGRKKGPAPLPPTIPSQGNQDSMVPSGTITRTISRDLKSNKSKNLSQSFPNLLPESKSENLGLGNVLQGQFVRVQVDQHRSQPIFSKPMINFRQRTGPEIIKYESLDIRKSKPQKVKQFDAFKFSDPKNLTGYQLQRDLVRDVPGKPEKQSFPEKKKPKGFSALMLYIPMYKSAKKQQNVSPGLQGLQGHQVYAGQHGVYPGHVLGPSSGYSQSTGTFTNRLFGMSSKLKEFGSLQSGCNPNKTYDNQLYPPRTSSGVYRDSSGVSVRPENGYYKEVSGSQNVSSSQESPGRFLGRLGKFGRSGSLGNLTILAQNEKIQSNTLKSVIKKRTKDEDDRRFGRHGKKVTFSAYNTVQVV